MANVYAQVFITSSSDDREVVEIICKALRAEGLRVLTAFEVALPGERISERLVTALKESDVVVFVLSESSEHSVRLNAEIALATARRLSHASPKLIPVATQRHLDMPILLDDVGCYSLNPRPACPSEDWFKMELDSLVSVIKSAISSKATEGKTLEAYQDMLTAQRLNIEMAKWCEKESENAQSSFLKRLLLMLGVAGIATAGILSFLIGVANVPAPYVAAISFLAFGVSMLMLLIPFRHLYWRFWLIARSRQRELLSAERLAESEKRSR